MTVTVATDLPIAAERACRLAQTPALLAHVLWPWVTLAPETPVPEEIGQGDEISVRIRFLALRWAGATRFESSACRRARSCRSSTAVPSLPGIID